MGNRIHGTIPSLGAILSFSLFRIFPLTYKQSLPIPFSNGSHHGPSRKPTSVLMMLSTQIELGSSHEVQAACLLGKIYAEISFLKF